MKPEEIRQIIIDDSGLSRGGPALTKFCRKYNLTWSAVEKHARGVNPPSRIAVAFYELVKKSNSSVDMTD